VFRSRHRHLPLLSRNVGVHADCAYVPSIVSV
jgi:hypothetical protein